MKKVYLLYSPSRLIIVRHHKDHTLRWLKVLFDDISANEAHVMWQKVQVFIIMRRQIMSGMSLIGPNEALYDGEHREPHRFAALFIY